MEIRGTDYTARKKSALIITIGTDEDPIELRILPPTKRILERMNGVQEALRKENDGELDYSEFDMGECLDTVAMAMSHNAAFKQITPDYLESIGFDITDMADFVGLYLVFLAKLVEGKN